jgi:hypothetical protein
MILLLLRQFVPASETEVRKVAIHNNREHALFSVSQPFWCRRPPVANVTSPRHP